MRCPNCEASVPDDSRFCNNCGFAMPEQGSIQQPVPQSPAAPVTYAKPAKDPNIALLIELVGTLFGFMGLGWIYAGDTTHGIIALVLWLIVVIVSAVISILTGGFFACLWLPAQIVAAIISGLLVKQRVERDVR